MNDWGQFVDAIGDGLVVFDGDGRFLKGTQSFLDLIGYDRDRIVGAELTLMCEPGVASRIERAIERQRSSNDIGREVVETTVETATGEQRAVELTVSSLTDDNGTFRVVAVVRDAAADDEDEANAVFASHIEPGSENSDDAADENRAVLERYECRLERYKRRLERYKRIVEVMGDGVYALDAEGQYTMINEYLLDLVGVDRETVLGADPALLHDEAQITAFESAIESLLDDGGVETVETTIETTDDWEIPVEVNLTLLPSGDGQFRGTVGVVRDVAERRRRERELERYERLIDATGDAVYALDTEGLFIFSNQAHQEIVDREKSALLGTHASITLPDEAVQGGQTLIQQLLDSDQRCGTYEMDVLRPDGEQIPTENHIALLTDEDGAFRGSLGVLRDITERKQRERELRRQNERLEQFASVVTHDLRNPLNVAQGYLEDVDGPAATEVDRSLNRMETIIEEVLELARQGQAIDDLEPVSLAETVRDAWANVETGDMALTVATVETVRADRNRLVTLLENLFRNAVEHGSTSPLSQAQEDTVDHAGASNVTVGNTLGRGFYVADDGSGIPVDERETVFDMGYTTGPDGTGFGLAIVAEIAAAHGWSVAVTDGRAAGARFEFTGVERATDWD